MVFFYCQFRNRCDFVILRAPSDNISLSNQIIDMGIGLPSPLSSPPQAQQRTAVFCPLSPNTTSYFIITSIGIFIVFAQYLHQHLKCQKPPPMSFFFLKHITHFYIYGWAVKATTPTNKGEVACSNIDRAHEYVS